MKASENNAQDELAEELVKKDAEIERLKAEIKWLKSVIRPILNVEISASPLTTTKKYLDAIADAIHIYYNRRNG